MHSDAYSSGYPDQRRVNNAAAKLLRQLLILIGQAQPLPDHLHWLTENGFSREDSRQIRYIVDVFCNSEPKFTIIYALEAGGVHQEESSDRELLPDAVRDGKIKLAALDINHPVISPRGNKDHPFFRALAMWPEYVKHANNDLKKLPNYNDIIRSLSQHAQLVAQQLCPDLNEIIQDTSETAKRLLDASAETVVAAFAMHRMFVEFEQAMRSHVN